MSEDYVIEMLHITKEFPGIKANDDITLQPACVNLPVRSQKAIPLWYKLLSVLMALAVCLSTLTMRQHVLADVFSGVLLAEVSYQLTALVFRLRSRRSSGKK